MAGHYKHFNRYGEPLWRNNTPEENRRRLILVRSGPSSKSRGGTRGKPRVRVVV